MGAAEREADHRRRQAIAEAGEAERRRQQGRLAEVSRFGDALYRQRLAEAVRNEPREALARARANAAEHEAARARRVVAALRDRQAALPTPPETSAAPAGALLDGFPLPPQESLARPRPLKPDPEALFRTTDHNNAGGKRSWVRPPSWRGANGEDHAGNRLNGPQVIRAGEGGLATASAYAAAEQEQSRALGRTEVRASAEAKRRRAAEARYAAAIAKERAAREAAAIEADIAAAERARRHEKKQKVVETAQALARGETRGISVLARPTDEAARRERRLLDDFEAAFLRAHRNGDVDRNDAPEPTNVTVSGPGGDDDEDAVPREAPSPMVRNAIPRFALADEVGASPTVVPHGLPVVGVRVVPGAPSPPAPPLVDGVLVHNDDEAMPAASVPTATPAPDAPDAPAADPLLGSPPSTSPRQPFALWGGASTGLHLEGIPQTSPLRASGGHHSPPVAVASTRPAVLARLPADANHLFESVDQVRQSATSSSSPTPPPGEPMTASSLRQDSGDVAADVVPPASTYDGMMSTVLVPPGEDSGGEESESARSTSPSLSASAMGMPPAATVFSLSPLSNPILGDTRRSAHYLPPTVVSGNDADGNNPDLSSLSFSTVSSLTNSPVDSPLFARIAAGRRNKTGGDGADGGGSGERSPLDAPPLAAEDYETFREDIYSRLDRLRNDFASLAGDGGGAIAT